MKKVLCLLAVLAMASVSLAGTITITAAQVGDDLAISYTGADVLGLALTVTTADGSITGYVADSTDAYFDVYIDMASQLDPLDAVNWDLTAGTPLATVTAAGQATLPATAVSVCLGHLEGVTTAPTTGKVATLAVTPGTYVITADTLRGGAVDADGAMTIVGLPLTVTVVADDECLGDVDGDGLVTIADVIAMINHINANGGALGQAPVIPGADVDGDGLVTIADVIAVIGHINANGGALGQAPCM